MSRAASIFQLVMYSITMVLAVAEIGFCINAIIVFSGYYYEYFMWLAIGGIIHGSLICIYLIAFFCMYRRNTFMVRTTTDLIMCGFFFVSSILVGVFCAMIAFAPAAPFLFTFIVEVIVVARSKVPGKWRMSLFNVCNGKNTNIQYMNQNVGTAYYPMSNQAFGGAPQYANVPNPGAPQYANVANPGVMPTHSYAVPYQTSPMPYQTPYGQSH
ncbi:hypothetical protein CcaverHIS002_0400630 [Cutaneotrichosporon cavernicola]|uniref:Uncharacterized protein n=1 Tax=Cutaneotrichosporon cavernicola TaxID=279322 RepID=A0AA48L3F8_9TREE|nr:uncharacterized protein CcaverHIS019_0400600 [Cutaneotrichosporon cavernicola]BEI83459.1 hypothetical protein CcaverHIS002_0400630 [Cutaneotrichosporon cavernicola]BEI91240.1 hypothetical protein CcaverHIS019_0400600 [Cutaneotrichosporon cavernicola]BEI99013.1 hypothetical protein CcaverHIS631_0400560 [Cutaneotrichosporon cavernicola]BEJ06787.1 hypothetical protein CcaverHIS641_0400560 [Cutaneotrichosporon cavernicola]